MVNSSDIELLTDYIQSLISSPLPVSWLQRIQLLYQHLSTANKSTNLTAITDSRDFLFKHIADSLSILGSHPELESSDLIIADLGCGAGFPGIPLAITCPRSQFHEIDSNGKKIAFVKLIIAVLQLQNCHAFMGRAREMGRLPTYRQQYDYVLIRAVADGGTLIRECRHLLKPSHGKMILYKTPEMLETSEWEITQREAQKARLNLELSPVFELPAGCGQRLFITIS